MSASIYETRRVVIVPCRSVPKLKHETAVPCLSLIRRVHPCPSQITSARVWDNLKHDTTRIVSAPSQSGTLQARGTNSRVPLSQRDTVRARDFSARHSKHGTKTRHDYNPVEMKAVLKWRLKCSKLLSCLLTPLHRSVTHARSGMK